MKFNGEVSKRSRQWVGRANHKGMTQILLIVGLDGYEHKYYSRTSRWGTSNTTGLNVHMSMNGPMQMTFEEVTEFTAAINEAVARAKFELEEHFS